jgi:hypothetical protein
MDSDHNQTKYNREKHKNNDNTKGSAVTWRIVTNLPRARRSPLFIALAMPKRLSLERGLLRVMWTRGTFKTTAAA